MSGHSKWASIKRDKGANDAKRGQLFTKFGREIAVAARDGADLSMNSRLRLAVQRARDANMPSDTIDRAIKRGAGAGDGANYQEISYEGYGPNGVAVLVDVLTDNRNRTVSEVRHVFNRNGGNLGETGSVRWLFNQRGVITAAPDGHDPDEVGLLAIDAGADDVQVEDDSLIVYTDTGNMEGVRHALEDASIQVTGSEATMVPTMTVELDEESAQRMMRLIERLEELDDVQRVFSNSEVNDEVAASLAG
ncbi:MAG: YebC/PmpR family DNA-binding transcriptional regulator [Chloroflexota bacterium]